MDGFGFGLQLKPPHRTILRAWAAWPASKCEKWFDFNGRHWVISGLRSDHHQPIIPNLGRGVKILWPIGQEGNGCFQYRVLLPLVLLIPITHTQHLFALEYLALGTWLIHCSCICIRTRLVLASVLSCGGGTWEFGLKNCNFPREEVCPWTIFRTTKLLSLGCRKWAMQNYAENCGK